MAAGIVKWFSDEKGFGFMTVSYDAEAGDKGPKAVNVQPV